VRARERIGNESTHVIFSKAVYVFAVIFYELVYYADYISFQNFAHIYFDARMRRDRRTRHTCTWDQSVAFRVFDFEKRRLWRNDVIALNFGRTVDEVEFLLVAAMIRQTLSG
jgi:hypothetical protein